MNTKLLAVTLLPILFGACHKKPDAPDPLAAPLSHSDPQPLPPVTSCQGSTVLYSLPGIQTVNDNSSKDFMVPGYETSCGDTLQVFMRKDSGQAWFELHDIDNGASYYSLFNQTVTVHNRTGIVQEVDIEAVLK